jgi:SARP family transcriptional regulator, regulator of embCAB operon
LIEFGVLGPLFIRVGSVTSAPSAPKPRNVLAMLVLHAGQVVSTSSLMQELWGDDPPSSGPTTLQTYIVGLRKLLASISRQSTAKISRNLLITTSTGGYLLETGQCALDIQSYYSSVALGRRALSAGDDAAGIRHLNEALSVWRGPALLDVTVGQVLESKRRQLEESRLVILEYLVDTQLRLGMYQDALIELAPLTVENPLHEGLHMQYMRALYFSGRRAQALEVFHRLRNRLVTDLGLEPRPPVQRLHQAILSSRHDFDDVHIRVGLPLCDVMGMLTCACPRKY